LLQINDKNLDSCLSPIVTGKNLHSKVWCGDSFIMGKSPLRGKPAHRALEADLCRALGAGLITIPLMPVAAAICLWWKNHFTRGISVVCWEMKTGDKGGSLTATGHVEILSIFQSP